MLLQSVTGRTSGLSKTCATFPRMFCFSGGGTGLRESWLTQVCLENDHLNGGDNGGGQMCKAERLPGKNA